jgi:hypothetical protein
MILRNNHKTKCRPREAEETVNDLNTHKKNNKYIDRQGRIYARAKGARAQGGKFPGAAN